MVAAAVPDRSVLHLHIFEFQADTGARVLKYRIGVELTTLSRSIDLSQTDSPLILALDIGSSSARAALVDGQGQRVAGSLIHTSYDHDTIASHHGSLNPRELTTSVEQLIDRILGMCAKPVEIAGVGVSTFWHSIMGVDSAYEPVTPVLMWSDIRSAEQCHVLERLLDPESYHRRTGTPIHSSYPPAKILWLAQTHPDDFQRVSHWMSFGEYLFHCLFGESSVSVSMVSASGLFNQAALTWDGPTLDVLHLDPSMFSTISDEAVTSLRDTYATRWPALRNAQWFPALGDGACANVGSGAMGTDLVALSIGTSGAMRMLWEGAPVAPPDGLWLYRLDAKRLLLGGALSEGGNLWEWITDRFQMAPTSDLGTEVAAIPPDSHGLTWLPFLAGERSTGWSPDAHGVLSGLTLGTTAPQILRAGLEAVAYRFALISERIDSYLSPDRVIVGSGNALVSDRNWPQIISDVIGWDLIESREPEASLRGAALVALERLGAIDNLERVAANVHDDANRFAPDMKNHATYRLGLARQQELYRRLLG